MGRRLRRGAPPGGGGAWPHAPNGRASLDELRWERARLERRIEELDRRIEELEREGKQPRQPAQPTGS